jgi:dipeptide/tripeptide permease
MRTGKRSYLIGGAILLFLGILLLAITYWTVYVNHPDNPVVFWGHGAVLIALGVIVIALGAMPRKRPWRRKGKGFRSGQFLSD